MESREFTLLMMSLLPRGDCWNFEENSIFTRIASGLSTEFDRLHSRLVEMREASFPKSDNSMWEPSLLFENASGERFNPSYTSIQGQFKFFGVTNVELIAPPDEPFVIYVRAVAKEEHYFSAGDRVGGELYHFQDENLEEQIKDILPAFCWVKFNYRSPSHA